MIILVESDQNIYNKFEDLSMEIQEFVIRESIYLGMVYLKGFNLHS